MTAILVYHRIGDGHAFHDVAAETFALHLDLIRRRQGGPELLLSFDDGTAGHWEAALLLEAAGLRGLFFISPQRLDCPGRLTRAQAREMARRGHILGSHGLTHRRFDRMNAAECRDELCQSQAELTALAGKPVEWLAPPGGLGRPDLVDLAREAGFRFIRTMEWGYAGDLSLAPALPVTRRTGRKAFLRMVEGRAPRWRWHLKRLARGLAGERLWTWVRERFG